jgi:hypothetical protein
VNITGSRAVIESLYGDNWPVPGREDIMRNGMASRIQTTVVGSYPVLPWMVGNSSRLVLRDAIMAVLKAQELAGLDLVSDGEPRTRCTSASATTADSRC